jgi:hypothetical protein
LNEAFISLSASGEKKTNWPLLKGGEEEEESPPVSVEEAEEAAGAKN